MIKEGINMLMFFVIKDHMYDSNWIHVLHFCTFYEKFDNNYSVHTCILKHSTFF